MSYFKINKDDIKKPKYFFLSDRNYGKTFYQILNEARNKLIDAKITDNCFDPRNYVWLIGVHENIPDKTDLLFGIRVVYVSDGGIRLYKEVI